jgi:hypothetical protein
MLTFIVLSILSTALAAPMYEGVGSIGAGVPRHPPHDAIYGRNGRYPHEVVQSNFREPSLRVPEVVEPEATSKSIDVSWDGPVDAKDGEVEEIAPARESCCAKFGKLLWDCCLSAASIPDDGYRALNVDGCGGARLMIDR